MAERRPRPGDYASLARYYTALLIWLDYRYDDQVDRARKFHKITHKEDRMPVQRKKAATVETAVQRAAKLEMEEMLERLGIGPRALEKERARIAELIGLDRDFTDDERKEWSRLVKRRHKRRRDDRRFTERSDEARRRWAERSVSDPEWAAKWEQRAIDTARRYDRNLERGHLSGEGLYRLNYMTEEKKRQRREARRSERRQARAATEAAEQERASATAQAPLEPESAPVAPRPAQAPAEAVEPLEPAEAGPTSPRRQRVKYGIVAVFDSAGNRVD